jgi:hypothetical protein
MADRLQGLVVEEWLSECPARAAEKLSQVSLPKVRMGPASCKPGLSAAGASEQFRGSGTATAVRSAATRTYGMKRLETGARA